ncbi:uncharacterized protein LOC144133924 [Amblyomma americanum]
MAQRTLTTTSSTLQRQQAQLPEAPLPPPEEWGIHGNVPCWRSCTQRVSSTREYMALCAFTYCLPVAALGAAVLIIYVFIEETHLFTPFKDLQIATEASPCLEQPRWAPCLPSAAPSAGHSLFYFDRQLQSCTPRESLPIPCLHQTAALFATQADCFGECARFPNNPHWILPAGCRKLRLAPCTVNDTVATYVPLDPSRCGETRECRGSQYVFQTLADCELACVMNYAQNRCVPPPVSASCGNLSRAVRWFFNAFTRACEHFEQLCLAGRNRFDTYGDCAHACLGA